MNVDSGTSKSGSILREEINENEDEDSIVVSDINNMTLDNSAIHAFKTEPGVLNIACANARSIVEKINSLITLFEECGLHICILTETWLTKKLCPPRVMSDLVHGANIAFIRRDRGARGGGVAICFDPKKSE